MRHLLWGILLVPFLSISQANDTLLLQGKLAALLNNAEKFGFTGAVILVKQGRLLIDKGYGKADRAKNIAFTDSTLVGIASVSKTFIVQAVMQLAGEGRLSVADGIGQFFPFSTNKPFNEITIQQLMTHTSGLPPDFFASPGVTMDSVIRGIAKLPVSARRQYSYANTNYNLLAAIITKVAGENYRQYITKHIFAKYGLYETQYLDDSLSNDQLYGHTYNRDLPFPKSNKLKALTDLNGAADMVSSAKELFRWISGLDLSSEKFLQTEFKPYIAINSSPKPYFSGYAWNVKYDTNNQLLEIRHGGNATPTGYTAEIRRYPAENSAIVILCTQMQEEVPYIRIIRDAIAKMMADPQYVHPLCLVNDQTLQNNPVEKASTEGFASTLSRENDLNYISVKKQGSINALWQYNDSIKALCSGYNNTSVNILNALKNKSFSDNPVAQADWGTFEKINGKYTDHYEVLGTIRVAGNLFTSFIRCEYEGRARVIRFVYNDNHFLYIAQNENEGPRWPFVLLEGHTGLVYDLASDLQTRFTMQYH